MYSLFPELLRLALRSLAAYRLRSALSVLGIAVGIASVILLTSVGEGLRRYIKTEFTQFGTGIVTIFPGKAETIGIPGVLGGTTHKLTIADAEALAHVPGVIGSMPVVTGTARVEAADPELGGRGRSVMIYSVTPTIQEMWEFYPVQGEFWPAGDPRRSPPLTVLGPTLKEELFGDTNALGQFVRIGGRRFRVVGLMEPKGQLLGLDLDDGAYIPVSYGLQLFNRDELTNIDIRYAEGTDPARVEAAVRSAMIERHRGEEDFSITSQAAMLDVLGNVINIVTVAVSGIAGISLLVGAVGILTMMWIAVGERTSEIGLLRAIGASRRQIRLLFLAEAGALAALGGLVGLAVGMGLCAVLRELVPALPVHTPLIYAVAAVGVSGVTGLLAGVLPARRASRLDPVEALQAE